MSRYTMGPCEFCGSSDAFASYEDGVGTCFSCNKSKKLTEGRNEPIAYTNTNVITDIANYSSYPISSRNLCKEVIDHFDVKMSTTPDGNPGSHYYPYTKKGQVVAYKERILPKDFRIHGSFSNVELFGQNVASGNKMLIITEGELDAMAVSQAFYKKYNRFFACVSIPSASATKVILEQRSWINKFETVILAFDQDEAGEACTSAVAKMIGVGKVRVASLPRKDACDVLIELGEEALQKCIWDAQPWSPAGIVVGEQIWSQFKDRQLVESVPYPQCLEGLNQKLKGIRHGEITLFTSGTGSGKSTVIKEIILDLLNKTNDKIGLISLEESIGDTAEKFISMQLRKSVYNPDNVTEEESRQAFDKVFGSERLILLDHAGSVSDSSLIEKIEYMALMGCKYLVLDHITIAVSEGSEGLSGNEAVDKIMSDLLKIVKRHNIWLGLISHLRKAQGGTKSFEEGKLASIDDIKGSGSIKQISFDIVSFARNLIAEDDTERNVIRFRVLKSRFTGLTGNAGSSIYNHETGRLSESGGFEFQAVGV